MRVFVPLMAAAFALTPGVFLNMGAARAQEFGDAAAGSAFAHEVCAECHEVESPDGASPHHDAPNFHRIAEVPGMTSTALFVALRTPHRQMPDLILTADEIRNVAAYILSLKDAD